MSCLSVLWSFLPLNLVCFWIPLWIFQFTYRVLQLSCFCLVLMFSLSCWHSHFVHTLLSWPQWTCLWPLFWNLYWEITFLHFINISFWSYILFFCLEYVSVPSFSLTLCIGFAHWIKQSHLLVLTSSELCERQNSLMTQHELLVSSQIFMTVQTAIFVLSVSRQLKVYQDLSVSQKEDCIKHLSAGWLEARPWSSSW